MPPDFSSRPAPLFTNPTDVHKGDSIRLPEHLAGDHATGRQLDPVIGFDAHVDRCWQRPWPLAQRGSPVLELALSAVGSLARRHLPRPC